MITVPKRPVELRKGVLVDSVFRYQEHNSGRIGQEDFGIDIAETSFGGAVVAVTHELTAQGEPTLVFVKDRRNSVRLCYRLAERVSLPPAQQAIEQLSALPPTSTRQRQAPATNDSARSGDLSGRGSLLVSRRIQAANAPGLLAGHVKIG